MLPDNERITWLASYPKSGNTWVRMLLQAYRCNGYLDINDMHTGTGDSSACYFRAVSPLVVSDLGENGEWLLRPAALLNAAMAVKPPRLFKTHYPNITVADMPAFIPRAFTQRAVYIVRDPRDVALSMSRFYNHSMETIVEQMASNSFHIGQHNSDRQVPTLVTSWSNHVTSWISQTAYPVITFRYEDILSDPASALRQLLEFLNIEDIDDDRCKRAAKACELSKLREQEADNGFAEYSNRPELTFFGKGGSRWKDEMAKRWQKRIRSDHGELMDKLGYA